MTVEELIAKLGFRISGQNEVRKFIADIQKVRKELAKLQSDTKGARLGFGTGGGGAGRLARDLERATAAARRYRQEMDRASRIRIPGGGYGPNRIPGRPIDERLPRRQAPGSRSVAAGVVGGNIITDAIRGTARVAAKPLVTFANEETAAKSLKLTADVSDQQVAKDHEKFRSQAADLGQSPQKMLEVANAFVAAGLKYEDAIAATVPTIQAAKAGRADVDDVAQAGIAAMNNLGIPSGDIKKAYDIMLASGKAGQVELKDLARVLPDTAASAQKGGYQGLGGLTTLTSQLQFARKGTATADVAANNVKNFLDKIFAEVTLKAFKKEAKVDLEKKVKAGEKKGLTAADVTLQELYNFTKGDKFKSKKLFGDIQAGDFVDIWQRFKGEIDKLSADVSKSAPGGVDRDFGEMMGTLSGKAEQVSSAFERLAGQIGQFGGDFAKGTADIAKAGLEGASGKQPSASETAGFVNRMNERFGLPPGYKTISGAEFNDRFGEGTSSPPMSLLSSDFRARIQGRGKKKTIDAPAPSYAGSTNPTLGSPTQRMDWMKQNVQQAASNTTNNNTSNSVSVSANGVGLKEVADMIAAKVKEAMAGFATKADVSNMGASIAKGNTTPTSPTLVGP